MTEPARLLPARMLNEMSFCPRLFALEWLHGEWADNHHTVEGRTVHKRVDAPTRRGLLPPPDPDAETATSDPAPPPRAVRSVYLSDDSVGMVAKIDLVEEHDGCVVPIDYKKGSAPDIPEGAYEPERVQVCAQALLLRAHGYTCTQGALWFAGSRRRVAVPIDDALVARTLALRDAAMRLAATPDGSLPPPLVDSPKCQGCSLVGICLPDEVGRLTGARDAEVRPLVPGRDDGTPLYVQLQGGSLGKDGGEIVVKNRGSVVARSRIAETSQVVLMGNASVSSALLAALADIDVPVAIHSYRGWFQGSFTPASGVGALLRIEQHRAASDPARCLDLARAIVISKLRNQRVLLRRNGRNTPKDALDGLSEAQGVAHKATDIASLMGAEGLGARHYFGAFNAMVKPEMQPAFSLEGRNRRPPRDPINAMLSFAYACLVREWTQILQRVGFDAWRGFLHQPRHGRPALALDLMEEFRPVIADSAVLTAVNTGAVSADHFLVHPTGVAMTDAGRRAFIEAWERRLDELTTHPLTGTRLSMRRVLGSRPAVGAPPAR